MAKATYRSVTCNVNTFDPNTQVAATIREAWGKADVLKLNEGGGAAAHSVVRHLAGAQSYIAPGTVGSMNPIIWRTSMFKRIAAGTRTVYHGGKGEGPSRGVTWVLLEHRATGKRVLECNYHQVARAFSSSPGRQDIWHQIQDGVAAEIIQTRNQHGNPPTVISGDVNRDDSVTFAGLSETEISLPPTMGGQHYDKFFIVGQIAHRSHQVFGTHSDHKAVKVTFEITSTSPDPTPVQQKAAEPKKDKPTASGKVSHPLPGPSTSTPLDMDLRRRATFRARPRWRYFALRATGDGSMGEELHSDLPLSDVEIDDVLTGDNGLSAKISPQYGSLVAPDGKPLLEEWGTEIYAEESGHIHGGGILTNSSFDGPEWSLECTGLTGYSQELPYASATFFVETDALDIFRHIWTHIQGQEGSNVGLEVDATKSGILMGVELEQVEFDTQEGPVSFESGPYKLAYYQDHDLGDNLSTLAADTPFDWHEEHYWVDDTLHHRLRLGYPTIGRRRTDLRFVVGENVFEKPSVERNGEDYADEVWVFGAGEGAAQLRGVASAKISRLRRVAVVSDPSIRTQKGVNLAARRELAWRLHPENIGEVVVRDHPHADVGSIQVGDEIKVQATTGWLHAPGWYRILSRKITPQAPNRVSLTLLRADRIAA